MQLVLILVSIFIVAILCWYIHVLYLEGVCHMLLLGKGGVLGNLFVWEFLVSLGIVIIPGVVLICLGSVYGFGLSSFICFIGGCVAGEKIWGGRIIKLYYVLKDQGFYDE